MLLENSVSGGLPVVWINTIDICAKFTFSQDVVKTPENVNKTTEVKGGSNTSVSLTFSSTSGHVDFAKSHKAPDKMLPDSKKITSFAPAKTSKEKTKSNQPHVIF